MIRRMELSIKEKDKAIEKWEKEVDMLVLRNQSYLSKI